MENSMATEIDLTDSKIDKYLFVRALTQGGSNALVYEARGNS